MRRYFRYAEISLTGIVIIANRVFKFVFRIINIFLLSSRGRFEIEHLRKDHEKARWKVHLALMIDDVLFGPRDPV